VNERRGGGVRARRLHVRLEDCDHAHHVIPVRDAADEDSLLLVVNDVKQGRFFGEEMDGQHVAFEDGNAARNAD